MEKGLCVSTYFHIYMMIFFSNDLSPVFLDMHRAVILFLVNKKGIGIIIAMEKPVKHRVKLRRSSSVGVFK